MLQGIKTTILSRPWFRTDRSVVVGEESCRCALRLGGGPNGWGIIGSLISKKPNNFQR